MSLVRKYGGKKKAVMVREELYEQAVRFSNKGKFTLASVFETAIEEFLEDRDDDDLEKSHAALKMTAKPLPGAAR